MCGRGRSRSPAQTTSKRVCELAVEGPGPRSRFFTKSPREPPKWPPFLDCLSAVTGACQESRIGFCL